MSDQAAKHYVQINDATFSALKAQAQAESISVAALTRRILGGQQASAGAGSPALDRIEAKLDQILAK